MSLIEALAGRPEVGGGSYGFKVSVLDFNAIFQLWMTEPTVVTNVRAKAAIESDGYTLDAADEAWLLSFKTNYDAFATLGEKVDYLARIQNASILLERGKITFAEYRTLLNVS